MSHYSPFCCHMNRCRECKRRPSEMVSLHSVHLLEKRDSFSRGSGRPLNIAFGIMLDMRMHVSQVSGDEIDVFLVNVFVLFADCISRWSPLFQGVVPIRRSLALFALSKYCATCCLRNKPDQSETLHRASSLRQLLPKRVPRKDGT